MKKVAKFLVPFLLLLLILCSIVWYGFVYDRALTRDLLLNQARHLSTNGNPVAASWFYDLAYEFTDQDESVAIELANQFKAEGNYTKAEYTLSNAIADGGTSELYIALCQTYVEQDKLLDAVNMLDSIADPMIKAELDQLRPQAPVADPVPGFYSQYIPVHLNCASGTLYYSTDGSYPSVEDNSYTEAFTLSSGETNVFAISIAENGLVSPLSILGYTVGGVIEEVTFTDSSIEQAVREIIDRNDDDPIFSNELWEIESFTLPQDAKYIDDLTLLTHLKKLEISGQTFDSLRFLSSLSHLTELFFSECRFQADDISFIAAIPDLKKLTLSGCSLSTIAGLEKAQNLEYVNLQNNTIRNLDPLAYLMRLNELNLQHNALTGLAALSNLPNLQKLDVSYNSLTSVAPLATCNNLQWFNANNNELISLNGIDNIQTLTYLSANHNQLSDISLLSKNLSLKELYVASNDITDISALSQLVHLEVLDFASNQIQSIPSWPDDAKLRIIDGSHNEIESLNSLQNQMHLTHVYMDYNQITSVDSLENCYKLVLVNVYGNEVEDVKMLTEHDIIVNWDPT